MVVVVVVAVVTLFTQKRILHLFLHLLISMMLLLNYTNGVVIANTEIKIETRYTPDAVNNNSKDEAIVVSMDWSIL